MKEWRPRIRVQSHRNHKMLTRIWLDDVELAGVVDISAAFPLDNDGPVQVTLVIMPSELDWTTVPIPEGAPS